MNNIIEKQLVEVQTLIKYGIIYQKNIREESKLTQEDLDCLISQFKINEEIREYIELFCSLDKEFKEHYGDINADEWNQNFKNYKHDTTWRGFWLGVVGNELSLFLNWLRDCIKNDIENIDEIYLEQNKKLNVKHVPYSVKIAHEIYLKYFKNLEDNNE